MTTPTLPPAASRPAAIRRTVMPALRTTSSRSHPPAPVGPFIDGRTNFDWSTASAFAPAPARASDSVIDDARVPRTLGPVDGAIADVAAIVLAWVGTPNARGYEAEVSPDPAFGTSVLQLSTQVSTELSLAGMPIPAGARLYWRVRAQLRDGVSAWSSPARFYAGGPRDIDAQQAREAAREEEARRESARRRALMEAEEALIPPYLRESAVTSSLDVALPAVMLLGMCLALILVVLIGLMG